MTRQRRYRHSAFGSQDQPARLRDATKQTTQASGHKHCQLAGASHARSVRPGSVRPRSEGKPSKSEPADQTERTASPSYPGPVSATSGCLPSHGLQERPELAVKVARGLSTNHASKRGPGRCGTPPTPPSVEARCELQVPRAPRPQRHCDRFTLARDTLTRRSDVICVCA